MKKIIYSISIILVFLVIGGFIINKESKKVAIPILMYHHFENDKSKTNDVTILASEFEKQIKYLKDNGYTSVDSNDIIDFNNKVKDIPEKPIFITSDDGYLSNYEIMYPILKKYDMKATIFLIGERIDNSHIQTKALPKLSWHNAKEMYESGLVDFQCHTYNSHDKVETANGLKGNFSSRLVNESDEEFTTRIDKDIKLNIEGIEKHLGYIPITFSYPFGDYSKDASKVLEENNIQLTVLAEGGVEKNTSKKYLLKRIGITNQDNVESFAKKIES